MKHTPDSYRHIAAWGRMMGSFAGYVKHEQELASLEDAPLTAVYRRDKGDWVVLEDCHPDTQTRVVGLLA